MPREPASASQKKEMANIKDEMEQLRQESKQQIDKLLQSFIQLFRFKSKTS